MNVREKRRILRRAPTEAEERMWSVVRRNQIDGLRFRRQHAIGPYFADFYCDAARLVVEIDGSIHDTPRQGGADQQRDRYLRSLGLEVLRIQNDEIFSDLLSVRERIRALCGERLSGKQFSYRRQRAPIQEAQ
jgi:very-short-patch-repair endonuclease